MSKRDLFSELTTALDDAKAHSQGKPTSAANTVKDINDLAISPDDIVNVRETSSIHQQGGSKVKRKGGEHLIDER
ncbi:hypothetical protein [Pseudoalteromonas sp. APC 3691]|uniref:hypothetical protein n=1 Tax=Pseudoalteromonas sp. APC 3691 TaxID=3035173 RepID=UPI0025B5FFD8|nr:hypothetical protein [Pseudoalteromonas sp. APC 3691]MDN3391878.1 hypothetical protein [Pseudoalteromonas sp. APC 3691]